MESHNLVEFPGVPAARDKAHVRPGPLEILSVGRNPEILRLRERVIVSRSDLKVLSLTPDEADRWARSSRARLWIFCSTVELPKLVSLACNVRRHSPDNRLLLLQGARTPGFERSLFHRVIRPLERTGVLLDAVSDLAV